MYTHPVSDDLGRFVAVGRSTRFLARHRELDLGVVGRAA